MGAEAKKPPRHQTYADEDGSEDAAYAPDTPPIDVDEKHQRTHGKRKQKKTDAQSKSKVQRTLSQVINPSVVAPETDSIPNRSVVEPEQNDARKKRRRTSEQDSVEVGIGAAKDAHTAPQASGGRSPQVLIPRSSPHSAEVEVTKPVVDRDARVIAPRTPSPEAPPKKLLRINANGTFSSPPTTKPKPEQPLAQQLTKRGRPRRAAAVNSEKHLIVIIGYGQDPASKTAVGERISRVLGGEEHIPVVIDNAPRTPRKKTRSRVVARNITPKKRTPRKLDKPAHPFFILDKPKDDIAPPKKESPRKSTAITPGKLRMQALADRAYDPRDHQPYVSTLNKDRLMVRHPGALDPPFPARGQVHVRGLGANLTSLQADADSGQGSFVRRKQKQARLPLSSNESVLARFGAKLQPDQDRTIRPDGFHEAHAELNVPERLLLSGQDIAYRISTQLSVPMADQGADELTSSSSQQQTHPALQRLYDRIPTVMTGFDQARGETASWTQKYAPMTSADVLQPVSEVAVLKDWLRSLTVQAVGGAAAATKATATTMIKEKPKKKRRKKADEMDDFLVESDEETHEMSELLGDVPASPHASRRAHNSVVHVAPAGAKLSNVLMLSGPHGCGKTAAAYGVARDLGFKIFEISSSERRSGKDVLDRVGDMAENHLMKHHGTEAAATEIVTTEEPIDMDEAFQKDLQSGRQGKMSAFFKPSTKAAPAPKPKKKPEPKDVMKSTTLKAVKDALKQTPKDQQQSLILLEEVDILFKDDKDFWTTIVKLIETSRRPFIMTCNDEDLVALQTITLHAILRFRPPPVHLATDYMLLLAAAEGHLLERGAVKSLYERHDRDLRASITELDYWCQMGVGDPKEGLGWIYQRWPPGSDIDHFGRTVRVVSNNTYQEGMGLATATDPSAEDALWWAWTNFGVEPSHALGWKACGENNRQPSRESSPVSIDAKRNSRRGLSLLAATADMLSAADACTALGLPGSACFDSTQPDMPEKAQGHYIDGMKLLQTDEVIDNSDLSKHFLLTMTLSAWKTFAVDPRAVQSDPILHSIPEKRAQAVREQPLDRRAFACFDAISSPAEVSLTNSGLQLSVFDGPLSTITTDLAPYVRSIVRYDQTLEDQRERLGLLDSDGGGRKAKRARTTRAARSALGGSQRSTTRKDKWFTTELDVSGVLATGGRDWPRHVHAPLSIGNVSREDTEVGDVPTCSTEGE
jgi:DNA polymerase III delta prime subunit